MKTRSIILSALAAVAFVACGQTPEEKAAAFDAAVETMENEYYAMRDSLASDMEAWNAYSSTFMDEYTAFNLAEAKKNLDNAIANAGVKVPPAAGLWEYPEIIRKNLVSKTVTGINILGKDIINIDDSDIGFRYVRTGCKLKPQGLYLPL